MALSSQTAAVTPDGIRDGDPAALAALVDRRANAVLAYCEAVCSPASAERAAAEAFARFRAAVAAAEDPRSLEPGALLLGATRHAAASLTITPTPPATDGGLRRKFGAGRGAGASETCALIPGLLAARAEGALSAADQERLARHLERHPACRALADAVDRAEADYVAPPSRIVPIGALTEIMLALTAAAPITAVPVVELEFADVVLAEAEPTEGELEATPTPEAEPELELEATPVPEAELEATPMPEPGLEVHPEAEAGPEPASQAPQPGYAFEPPQTRQQPREPASAPGPAELPPAAVRAPEPTTTVFRAVVPGAEQPRTESNHTGVLPPGAARALPAGAGGVAHPRSPRRHLHLRGAARDHGVLYHYVLPGTFVAAALLAAMGAAGFFSTDARPNAVGPPVTTSVPAAPPAGTPPVPRASDPAAEERTALAAERRNRQERAATAKRRRAREAATATSPATRTETTPPAVTRSTPEPEPAPVTPPRTTPKQTTTTAKEPAKDSSALPDPEGSTTPSADPGVFEAPPPTP